ncbi:ABC transporter substrate-binding protein [Paenarthrobacter ureafaciens]|uniref:ABC transporter substrate-binding protein n=1 Tax=Paenarthrobacter ureafaciens TaxID=37931 RepID=UPI002DBB1FCF|nr:sugar ABC transporter substrate-binding protein [Paenarthrobacter ureafaciens]MEC3853148.1 sugar ABC transporter substrate-binding protein [Paenarthrobacter ureafaciens]
MTFTDIKRRSLIGIAGASAMLLLAGCGAGTPTTQKEDGPVTLKVALWGDTKRADLYQQAIDLYEKAHPNVTIELQFADLTPYLERLTTSAAAKDLPDVLFMRDTHVGRYGSGGALLDLKDFIGNTINVDDLGEAAVSTGEVDGGVYALPTHYVGQAIVYNKEVFEKQGINVADIKTWDDLADAAKKLSDPANSFWGMSDASLDNPSRGFEAFVRQNGQEVFTEKGGIGFDADVAKKWLQYWKDLRDAKAVPPADVQTEANSSGLTNTVLPTGKAAMAVQSTNHITQLQALTKTPLGLSSLPITEGASKDWRFFPPILISAAANTKHPQAAADFINFILNDVDAGLITGVNQGAPSSSKVRDALAPKLDEKQSAFVEQISREQQEPARAFPIRPEGSEQLTSSLLRAAEEVAYGRKSVDQAVTTLMSDAKRALPGK